MLSKQLLQNKAVGRGGERGEGDEENDDLWQTNMDNTFVKEPTCLEEIKHWSPYSKAALGISLGLLLLFPYVAIFALIGVVSRLNNDDNSSTSSSVVTAAFPTTMPLSLQSDASSILGKGASLSNIGEVQIGAGTTVYLNTTTITTFCPSYLNMEAVYEDVYLVNYANENDTTSTIQVVQISSPTEGVVKSSLKTSYYLYEIAALSTSNGLFIGIAQDSDPSVDTSYLVAGTVGGEEEGYTVTLSSSPIEYSQEQYELNPVITRLTDTSFAIAYYCLNSTAICSAYGAVDPTSLVVSLSPAIEVLQNPYYSIQIDIQGMSDSSFLVIYYDSYDPTVTEGQGGGSGHLSTVLLSIDTASITAPVVGVNSTLGSSEASFYFKVTRLDDFSAVIVYADPSINYGIKCQIVQLITSSVGDTFIVYGASWTANSGQALSLLSPYLFMDLDVVTVSTSKSFAILYSDFRNAGAMTVTTAQLTLSGNIVRTSPDFVISAANKDGAYAWGALAGGMLFPWASQTAILTAFTGTDCSTPASTTFSLLESKPSPIGVIRTSSSYSTEVVVGGLMEESLQFAASPGRGLYSNSMGDIVEGSFVGSLPLMSSASYEAMEVQADGVVYDAKYDTHTKRATSIRGDSGNGSSGSGSSSSSSSSSSSGISSSSSSSSGGISSSSSSSSSSTYYYIIDQERNALISLDGRVGMLITESSMLVQVMN